MTLADMASFVCGKVNQTEANDVASCVGFLQRRRDMIWNDQLWKDSIVEYVQTLDPTAAYTPSSVYLPTKGVLLLPQIIERVLGARTDARTLDVRRPEFFYRIDYDAFAKQGSPTDFLPLGPCVWEFDTAQSLAAVAVNAQDAGLAVLANLDYLDSDLTDIDRSSFAFSATGNSLPSTQRIESFSKPATLGTVQLGVAPSLVYARNNSGADQTFLFYLGNSSNPDFSVFCGAGQTVACPSAVFVDYYGHTPNAIGVPGGLGFVGTIAFDGLVFTFTAGLQSPLITLQPSDTVAKRRQRIRFVQTPQTAFTVRVLGKRYPPTFTAKQDEPGLSGIDNCLLAFAQADMLERERHYAKAQAKQQEGVQLLNQLKAIEVVQQSHNQQIVPEQGYADDYALLPTPFSF